MGQEAAMQAPRPKSPPRYPDLCGRRRLQLELQILNREIDFLKDELQSLEGVQPVSRSCKEVNEFVGTKQDPLIPIKKKKHRSCRLFWWIRNRNCAHASHAYAARVSAFLSAKNHVASVDLAANVPISHAASRAATHVASRAVGQNAARAAMPYAASLIAHPVAQTAARAAVQHAASQNSAASRSLHAVSPSAAAAAPIVAPAASQAAAPAAHAVGANNACYALATAATASQAAAVAVHNAAPAQNAAPAPALGGQAALVASSSSHAPTCLGAPANNALSASHLAARERLLAASVSHRAVRDKKVAAAAAGHASLFQSRRALDVLVGVFGPAGNVQRDADVPGAVTRAVPLVAYVRLDLFLL
ncbi:hypothetical protein ACP70R_006911 [Stipagrostis hirtigluma subsp. patula]